MWIVGVYSLVSHVYVHRDAFCPECGCRFARVPAPGRDGLLGKEHSQAMDRHVCTWRGPAGEAVMALECPNSQGAIATLWDKRRA